MSYIPGEGSRCRRRARRRESAPAGVVERLERRALLAGNLSISEFMAVNVATLTDENGDYSDWIEVRNAGATPASTSGYSLTDDPALPRRWVFPDVTIPAGGHLVVFASGKDRRTAGSNLHTNFSLDGDGEYLALFEPDGSTAATQFAPVFPEQHADVSYGFDPASPGGTTLRRFDASTPGAANVRAEAIINEIHYDPDIKTEQVEFIEVHNPGAAAVDLSGASFNAGVTYTFPAGTLLRAGAHLVVTQDLADYQAKFGRPAFAQWQAGGKLDNDGETIRLVNRSGGTLDQVDYQLGFPWPTVADPPGHSIELINPDFDNDLGGNWRSGGAGGGPSQDTTLFPSGTTWRYRKGTSEASSPTSTWRQTNFTTTGRPGWATGTAPIGYDANAPMGTLLSDMPGGYHSVFMRKTFSVADPTQYGSVRLEASYDDGFNVWVNGNHVRSENVASEEMAFDDDASTQREDGGFYTFNVPLNYLVAGNNAVAVQFHNVSLSGSSDAFFDARLIGSTGGATSSPTPGARNSAFAANAAPAMRQVEHLPQQPTAGQAVTITAKVTDPQGVQSVSLKYQLVNPGSYIAIDDPAYDNPANWTTVAMVDNGTGGDATAADGTYTAVLPGSLQTHRRLVRYRITTADTTGASITAPYADDPTPNFAYYVYNGTPAWTAAAQPGATPAETFTPAILNSLPVYQLLTTRNDHEDSQHIPDSDQGGYGGDQYLWDGALVYDGKVYDHIRYRARGGVWRYAMGKNMWKFDFNRGRDFVAKDAYGNEFPEKWSKLNLGANIQQGQFGQRGEQGLFESVGFQLFNLAGVPGSRTTPIHFRIVENASQNGPTPDQYDDDFQGLYLAVEQDDGTFLDAHDLPDGNFYKMESGSGAGGGSSNNQGPTQPTDNSDLVDFVNNYNGNPTDQWWRDNFDLDGYYNYRAIVEGIHHYDIGGGKNYFYYHNPVTDKWAVIPWDLDLTWADNMFGGGEEPFRDRVLSRPGFEQEYRNRLRELRDLLFNAEQVGQMLDAYADLVDRPQDGPGFVDADRAMWDYNPIMNSGYVAGFQAGHGKFYDASPTGDFRGMVERMKGYVAHRGNFIDDQLIGSNDEAAAPRKRTISYTGPAGFPADALTFSTTAFAAGNVGGTFAAMQWRVADVTPVATGQEPRYEINADWTSAELTSFNANVTVPSTAVRVGHQYRLRVRMKDSNGRWSHWSDPREFTAGAPNSAVRDNLRITEIHYHPAAAPGGVPAEDEFEFVELQNTGAQSINLRDVRFMDGIEFTFGNVNLAGGAYGVLVRNPQAFAARYGAAGITVLGTYTGALDNAGDHLLLVDKANQEIHNFDYDDVWHPTTDGDGYSLVKLNPVTAAPATWGEATGWRPSASGGPGGSPGGPDTPPPAQVVGRRVFYNRSAWDGNNATPNAADDAAIAADKSALLPGGSATFANYTSYSRGLNGLMVDIAGLVTLPVAADFVFKVGNDNNPAAWATAPAPTSITRRTSAGASGSDRVTIIWADGAIKGRWLQVTVKATANTGLTTPDVFYFGNAVGESGNSTADAAVTPADEMGARANQRTQLNPAALTFRWDYNRDKRVDPADQLIARANKTGVGTTALRRIAAPPAGGALVGTSGRFAAAWRPAAAFILPGLFADVRIGTPARDEGADAALI